MRTNIILALIGIYFVDVLLREKNAAVEARSLSDRTGKPLLNVGSGTLKSSLTGAKLRGDVNCDIAAEKNIKCGNDTVCYCDVTDLNMFSDKHFGVALAANILRYVPNKTLALKELHRVADNVIVTDNILPWPQLGPGPKFPVH